LQVSEILQRAYHHDAVRVFREFLCIFGMITYKRMTWYSRPSQERNYTMIATFGSRILVLENERRIRSNTSFLRSLTHSCIVLHLFSNINLLIRLVARMGASHAPGRGSIPRWGISFCWLGQLCLRLPSFRSSAATEYTAAQT
jgi:hypothetical protein